MCMVHFFDPHIYIMLCSYSLLTGAWHATGSKAVSCKGLGIIATKLRISAIHTHTQTIKSSSKLAALSLPTKTVVHFWL